MMTVFLKSTVRPLPVRQPPVVEHLQQDVEDVIMCLLHLIKQDDLIRAPPHCLGQRAAFLIADIARRRADQARDGVLLHELAHVDARPSPAHHRTGTSANAFTSSVLPTPVGPRNRNEPIGRLGSCSPALRTPHGLGRDGFQRLLLPNHAVCGDRILHPQQLGTLAFEHLLDRHTGPAGDDLRGDAFGRSPPH